MNHVWVPLAAGHGPDRVTLAVLTIAAGFTAVVAGLAIAAFVQRRSRPYLLVALALSALVGRTVVGLSAYTTVFDASQHHLLEHGLDVVMAALVIAAVYLVRSSDPGDHSAARRRADGGVNPVASRRDRTDGGHNRDAASDSSRQTGEEEERQ